MKPPNVGGGVVRDRNGSSAGIPAGVGKVNGSSASVGCFSGVRDNLDGAENDLRFWYSEAAETITSPVMFITEIPICPAVETVLTTSGQLHVSIISRQKLPMSIPLHSHSGEPSITGDIGRMLMDIERLEMER